MAFTIRPARKADLPHMYKISINAHHDNYGALIPPQGRADFVRRYTLSDEGRQKYLDKMQARLDDPSWFIWVAVDDETVLGYTLAHKLDEHLVQKKGLFVNPASQGKGVGSALLQMSSELIESGEIFLTVIENNHRARKVYEKYGFQVVGPAPDDFYRARQVIMRLTKA